MHTLKGRTAIRYAEKHDEYDGELRKYSDPTEGPREGLSVYEANKIAEEDPSLIYLRVASGKRNPKGARRVRKALKKYVKGQLAKKKNPPRSKSRNYEVSIPASRGDRGYLVKIKAPSAASAKAAARKYCAGRQGVPVSKYKLPRGTKARVV